MNQEVTNYLNNHPEPWQIDVCHQLRQVAQQAIADIEERRNGK
jgi:hypothetical protein